MYLQLTSYLRAVKLSCSCSPSISYQLLRINLVQYGIFLLVYLVYFIHLKGPIYLDHDLLFLNVEKQPYDKAGRRLSENIRDGVQAHYIFSD